MTEQELAAKIVELTGGKENISTVRHCATRLRIVVVDREKIDTDAVENLERVKGSFFNSGQYQIILGTGLVNRIYDEVIKITGDPDAGAKGGKEEAPVYGNKFQRAIRMFSDVFVPVIPVLVATGLFMGLRGLLTQEAVLSLFGMTPGDVPQALLTYTQILTDTAFAFLPALVCWSTFRNFGGSPVIGIVLGLMLVSPSLPSAYDVGSGAAEPLIFFGFLRVAGYQGSVLPAFATGILTAKFEKFLRRHVPDAVDLIVTPFVTLLVGSALAMFLIGPVLHMVENVVLVLVEKLLFLPMGLGGLLYGSFGQTLGIFGIHHILNFLEISMLANDGWNYLNPIGTCGNVAQAGAVLAVAIKARSVKTKQIAYPSCLSALLGITEPAVFGVNLRFVKPFIMAMAGGGIGGFLASLFHLRATGMAITGIPGTLLYLNEQLPIYILVNVVSFGAAFALTWFFGFSDKTGGEKKAVETEKPKSQPQSEKTAKIGAVVSGTYVAMAEIPDQVFAQGVLGQCCGIKPEEGKIYAPFDGTVTQVADTKHAIGLQGPKGVELLIHVGLDTVDMNGQGFDVQVKEEQEVHKGQLLMTVDLKQIAEAGHPDVVMMAVTNSDDYEKITWTAEGRVAAGDDLAEVE